MFNNLMKKDLAKKVMVFAGTVFGVALASTILSKDKDEDIIEDEETLTFDDIEELNEESSEIEEG